MRCWIFLLTWMRCWVPTCLYSRSTARKSKSLLTPQECSPAAGSGTGWRWGLSWQGELRVLVKVVRIILHVAIWWDQPCVPREQARVWGQELGTVPGQTSEGHLEWLLLSLGVGGRIPQVSIWRFTLSRDEAQGEALSQHPQLHLSPEPTCTCGTGEAGTGVSRLQEGPELLTGDRVNNFSNRHRA